MDNAEYVQNICSLQFDNDKAHDRSQPLQEANPLLPVFQDHSSFQTYAHDSHKSPIHLQDANVQLEKIIRNTMQAQYHANQQIQRHHF